MPKMLFGHGPNPWTIEIAPDLHITIPRRPGPIRRLLLRLVFGFRYTVNPPPGLIPFQPDKPGREQPRAHVPDFPPLD